MEDKSDIINSLRLLLHMTHARDDYKEFLELCIVFLGETPRENVSFMQPGAVHHARWMAKIIYSLKIYLFREQFELKADERTGLEAICVFIVKVYVKAWFSAPISVSAPQTDFSFLQKLHAFRRIDDEISKTALKKFLRHLWYLSPENVALAFFDKEVSLQTKRRMREMMLDLEVDKNKEKDQQMDNEDESRKVEINFDDVEDVLKSDLAQFITSETTQFFSRFEIKMDFIKKDPTEWHLDNNYMTATSIVTKIRVVNDTAERGVKLIEDFNATLTKNEKQKQYLLQVVADYRKNYPSVTKKKLVK